MIELRAVEAADIDYIHALENNPENWSFGDTNQPIAKQTLVNWIDQGNDIYESRRLRLMVCEDGACKGCVDLYNLDFYHLRGYVAILIEPEHRGKGIASYCLQWLTSYVSNTIGINKLLAEVPCHNEASVALFKGAGYEQVGTLPQWQRQNADTWHDVLLLQKSL